MTALVLSVASAAVWLYLVTARGGFWRCAVRDTQLQADAALADWPDVAAVVPARDEAAVIGESIASLLAQDFPGRLDVVIIDDMSEDGTGDVARATAEHLNAASRLTVVRGSDPPSGWAGKLWAMQQGLEHVGRLEAPPAYVLLTDADIAHAPSVVRRLAGAARARGLVLASLMARLRCDSLAERLLIPAFIFFFQKLYPFAWANDPRRALAAAAGGCMLVDRAALVRAGGLGAIRGSIIDDCALARILKREGPIFLGLTENVVSLRPYPRFGEIRRMVVRSAFAELRFSPLRLMGAVLGMGLTYLAPPILAVCAAETAQLLALFAWALMMLAYLPTLRFYGRSRLWALALPAIALIYMGFTIESAIRHWRGKGGLWKGRLAPRSA